MLTIVALDQLPTHRRMRKISTSKFSQPFIYRARLGSDLTYKALSPSHPHDTATHQIGSLAVIHPDVTWDIMSCGDLEQDAGGLWRY